MKNTKEAPMNKENWDEINSILGSASSIHMGELSREKLKKIDFLLAETENFTLIDRLRREGTRFTSYLKTKYPLLSDKSCSALEERTRFMDR